MAQLIASVVVQVRRATWPAVSTVTPPSKDVIAGRGNVGGLLGIAVLGSQSVTERDEAPTRAVMTAPAASALVGAVNGNWPLAAPAGTASVDGRVMPASFADSATS